MNHCLIGGSFSPEKFHEREHKVAVGTLIAFSVRSSACADDDAIAIASRHYKCLASQAEGGMASVTVVDGRPRFDKSAVHPHSRVVPWITINDNGK